MIYICIVIQYTIMETQDLIPILIQQDMKHWQLVEGIHRAGFESDMHYLGLMRVVATLMGLPEGDVPAPWLETYMDYLAKAGRYPLTGRGDNLEGLAKECFYRLLGGI